MNSGSVPLSKLADGREASLRMFAALLGSRSTKIADPDDIKPDKPATMDLSKLLFYDASSPTGGAVCSLPSLDLYSGDLPANNDVKRNKPNIPAMTASVTNLSISSKNPPNNNKMTDLNSNAAKLEKAAALNMGSVTSWNRSTVHQAPSTILSAISRSFLAVVNERVHAWLLLLLRQALASGDETSRSQLKHLSQGQSLILKTVSTSFKALVLPDNLKKGKNEEEQIILPLLFELASNVVLHEEGAVAKFRAPGTILGSFCPNSTYITSVKINLDTKSLVSSMVEQARLIVFKVIANSSSSPASQPSKPKTEEQKAESPKNSVKDQVQVQVPVSNPNPKMRPTNSVLKMRSVYSSTKVTSTSTFQPLKPTRSVTWSNAVNVSGEHDTPVNYLKSSKSFGKPDANVFEAKRNATFADFGRARTGQSPFSFTKGKLRANRTMASLSGGTSGANETFTQRNVEFSAASLSLSQKLKNNVKPSLLTGMSTSANAFERIPALNMKQTMSRDQIPQPNLPSTPLALEELFKAKARQGPLSS